MVMLCTNLILRAQKTLLATINLLLYSNESMISIKQTYNSGSANDEFAGKRDS